MSRNPELSSNIPSRNALELAGALQGVINGVEATDFDLQDHQDDAIRAVGLSLVNGETSGYVEMATSTGKTAIEALVAQAAVAAGKRVLLLAPKISIARQISGKDQPNLSGIAKFTELHDQTTVGHHFGSSSARLTDQVVITTYSSFLNDAERGYDRLGQFDVVIGDECHRSLGSRTATALTSSYPEAVKLGFSATPDFATDRKSEEIFGKKIYEFSLRDAIESGKTAAIRALLFETDEQLAITDTAADFTSRELAPFIENVQRNGTAMKLVNEFVKDGRKGIVRCIPGYKNAHARLLAEQLSSQYEVRAEAVGSHLTQDEQRDVFHRHAIGEIDCLTSTKAVEEGFDSDLVSFFINLSPTTSPVVTKQSMGRILRRNPDGRESIYVDFIDRTSGMQKPQYTALHALDLETVDFDRILGRYSNAGELLGNDHSHLGMDNELLQRIMRSNGRLLTDVLTQTSPESESDRLQRKWNRMLEIEGLPADLPENIAFDLKLYAKYELGKKAAMQSGIALSHEAILEHIPTLSRQHKAVLGGYGLQLSIDGLTDSEWNMQTARTYSQEDFDEQVEKSRRIEDMRRVLTEREHQLLTLRWLDTKTEDGTPETLAATGKALNLSPERIRQIESKMFAKIRQADRRNDEEQESIDYEAACDEIKQRFDIAFSWRYTRAMLAINHPQGRFHDIQAEAYDVDAAWVHRELSSYSIDFPKELEDRSGVVIIDAARLLSQQYAERRDLAAKTNKLSMCKKYQHILDVLNDMKQRSRDGAMNGGLIEYPGHARRAIDKLSAESYRNI